MIDMVATRDVVLGFDPGGKDSFGWSVCRIESGRLSIPTDKGVESDAQGAISQAIVVVNNLSLKLPGHGRVVAAGVDAPMCWSRHGDRQVDKMIRKALPPKKKSTVIPVNSLVGSCLVQGVLLGKYLHEKYGKGGIRITETHPTALRYLLEQSGESEDLELLIDGIENNHERDATISAFAAWKMGAGSTNWRNLYLDEPCKVWPADIPVEYWMPIESVVSN